MGKKLILGLMIGMLAIAYGCSKESTGTTAYSLGDLDYPIGSTDVAAGTEVYAEFCEGCHPGGEEGDGPKIAGTDASPSQLRWKVRSGGDDMPAFGPDKISDADLETLLAYALTIGAVAN
ncbi:MAG: cytochrome c [Deltaproteobacteria bacterium]|nr:cytochrome c [Deltaproteobacteria bacterium]